jgi:hypothetical protein
MRTCLCVSILFLAGCFAYGARDPQGGDAVSRGMDSSATTVRAASDYLPPPFNYLALAAAGGLAAAAEIRRRMLDRAVGEVVKSIDAAKRDPETVNLAAVKQSPRAKALVDRHQGKR